MTYTDDDDIEARAYTWADPVIQPGPLGTIDVIARMIEAMNHVGAVGKDRQHRGDQGDGPSTGVWSYRSADDVVTAAGPALAAAGVLMVPTLIKAEKTSGPDGWRIRMRYRFYAADGSSATVEMEALGIGRTAFTIGAAYSYALKYALSQVLAIPFDDPRMDQESEGTAREAQREVDRPWWDRAGWSSADQHGGRRQALLRRIKELPEQHQRTAKLHLAEQSTYALWGPNGAEHAGGIWVPAKAGQPAGPGMLAAGLSREACDYADQFVADLYLTAVDEAAGREPFDVGPPPAELTPDQVRELAAEADPEGYGLGRVVAALADQGEAEASDEPTPPERSAADVLADTMAAFLVYEDWAGNDTRKKGMGTQRARLTAAANRANLGSRFRNLDEFLADLPAVAQFEAKLAAAMGGEQNGPAAGAPDPAAIGDGPEPDTSGGGETHADDPQDNPQPVDETGSAAR